MDALAGKLGGLLSIPVKSMYFPNYHQTGVNIALTWPVGDPGLLPAAASVLS